MKPTGLPVEEVVPEVRAALAGAGQAVLVAPPGAGKTTVVPLRLLDESWLGAQRIVVLEPRRLATRAAARRMASLLGDEVGGTVGYVTRDDRRVSDRTRVEVVTEGVLTRRLQRDPSLPGVGLVVFDELHERNLQTDLGLAMSLDVRRSLRPDLRLLAMSATLDSDRVALLLGGTGPPAPVVQSSGRLHPVEIRWAPGAPRARVEAAVTAAVQRALREEEGDLLVFLPGAAEIQRVKQALGDQVALADVDVRPLYGALALADQDAALAPSPPGRRRIVLATDIAESSLTVEGVRVVVDAGLARRPRFDSRTGMTRLTTVAASKASADQRAGRAGRTGPGAAYRVWSKLEHASRRPQHQPEITEVDLAGLALELAAWGADPGDLAWLDSPPPRSLEEATRLLAQLGALDEDERLTPSGRAMADLPLHPRLARMVTDARRLGQGWLACLLAALIEDRDVLRGRPDDLPVDVATRVALLADPERRHPRADGSALRRARDRARDLARRARVELSEVVDPDRGGRLLALAFPDRLALAKGGPGRFTLRTGTAAWVPEGDPLAAAGALVAAELDGRRRDARIRLAAALDPLDLLDAFGAEVEEHRSLTWDRDRDDLVERVEQRLGQLRLGTTESRPAPGAETVAALVDRVRATRLASLPWTEAARSLRARVAHLRLRDPGTWPDWSDRALVADLDAWLAPHLPGATGRADLDALDLAAVLRSGLDREQQATLDQQAPTHLELRSGRRVPVRYEDGKAIVAARVQDLYGTSVHPTVAGEPVVLELLSPAGRPIQITADLPGFWAGSWVDVRKDMAGRYPKHAWPEDPATATPTRPGDRG